VAALPPLAAALPPAYDADEAAADYQALFGLNIFPYEAIFRDDARLLGGAVTAAVAAFYRQSGYAPDMAASSPDHFGTELGLLAFLCGAEADALRDGQAAAAARAQRLQRAFLADHLLAWLPPLALAIAAQESAACSACPFYTALARLAVELASEHAASLGELSASWSLPEPPPLLENEKTGLKQIAAYLLAPPQSGVYLSRDAIGRLARAVQLPHGFGGREQMLRNLLQAAAHYGELGALLAELQQVAAGWQAGYRALADAALAPYAAAWEAQAARTGRLLAEMGTRVGELHG
jgi:putative dimethyl sulfoxide reductase chaperone